MTPATDAIMGALPKEQFGVGSAVNDTVREIGGAFGVAILGSIFAAMYASTMTSVTAGLSGEAAAAAQDSLIGAASVAASMGGDAGAALLGAAQSAFVEAMSVTSLIGIGFAIAGALVALIWLPARAGAAPETDAAQAGSSEPTVAAVATATMG